MENTTPDTRAVDRVIERVLLGDALRLDVVHYVMSEYVGPQARCRVTLTIRSQPGAARHLTVDGVGAGFVDAIYRGLAGHFTQQCPGIGRLVFTAFEVVGHMQSSRHEKGLDAEARVRLTVQTPRQANAHFDAQGRSTLAAAIHAVAAVVEHFINAERAASRLRLAAEVAGHAGEIATMARIRNDLEVLRPLVA